MRGYFLHSVFTETLLIYVYLFKASPNAKQMDHKHRTKPNLPGMYTFVDLEIGAQYLTRFKMNWSTIYVYIYPL